MTSDNIYTSGGKQGLASSAQHNACVARVSNGLHFSAEHYSSTQVYNSADGHRAASLFGYYDKAAINILVQVFHEHRFSFLLCKHLGVALLGWRADVCA